jgi:membrane fusion protein (multidrug efflux system)
MLDPIYVDFTIAERYLPQVTVGNRVEVTVAAYPQRVFAGEVLALETSVNSESRTMQIRAALANSNRELRSGMFANVISYQGASEQVLTLPRTAISYNTYGDFVFVIKAGPGGQQTVERRTVTTGGVRAGQVTILSGVEAGEQVVATGLLRLRNGQPVTISNAEALHGDGADS